MNPLLRSHLSDRIHAALTLMLAARLFAVLLLCTAAAMAQESKPGGKTAQAAQEFALAAGRSIEREIAGGETHSYSVTLQSGQFLRAVVSPREVDVVAVLYGPGGEKLLTIDLLKYPAPEPVSFVAEKAGVYRLEVGVDAPATLRGRYELTSEVKAAASAADRERLAAERLLAEAVAVEREGLKESLQRSIEKRDESLALWRKLGDKYWEAYALHYNGRAYSHQGDKQKGLDYYNQALPLRREIEDKSGEALTLNNVGNVYNDLGEKQKALEFYNQALPLTRAVGDKSGEAATLNNIGKVYSSIGEKQKALEFYNQALPLKRAVGDKSGEALTLGNLEAVQKAVI